MTLEKQTPPDVMAPAASQINSGKVDRFVKPNHTSSERLQQRHQGRLGRNGTGPFTAIGDVAVRVIRRLSVDAA